MSSDTNTTEVDDDSLVARTVKDITHNLTLVMEGGGGSFRVFDPLQQKTLIRKIQVET